MRRRVTTTTGTEPASDDAPRPAMPVVALSGPCTCLVVTTLVATLVVLVLVVLVHIEVHRIGNALAK